MFQKCLAFYDRERDVFLENRTSELRHFRIVNWTISYILSTTVASMTTFGGSILANFWLHEDEKILLYFSECSSKVSLCEIILNTLLIDDFFANSKTREETSLSNSKI